MTDSVQTAVVIGAGIVGLSCAWHLQELGVEVTVVERADVASGASWGNAGWLTPSLAAPLPEPAVLRYGLRALMDRSSPLVIPLRPDASLAAFLTDFATHCRMSTWASSMAVMRPLNDVAIEAYDEMVGSSVQSKTVAAPVICGFVREADARSILDELRLMAGAGQKVHADLLTAVELSDAEPLLSPSLRLGVRLHGQRYIDPAGFNHALADAVIERGGKIELGWPASCVRRLGNRVIVQGRDAELTADAVVVATGAWIPELIEPHGVRVRIQAGRGYSLTVPVPIEPSGPLYFPSARLACTPIPGGRMRVAGMMEFGRPDGPPDERRWELLLATLSPFIPELDGSQALAKWVGPRPVSSDGLPMIGQTKTPGVYVAGGHGMWGITLGPATGRFLAALICKGTALPGADALSPLRV